MLEMHVKCSTVFRLKIRVKLITVKFNAILGYGRFMQIRQRIFKCTNMQIMHFILDKILKLLMYHTPFCH